MKAVVFSGDNGTRVILCESEEDGLEIVKNAVLEAIEEDLKPLSLRDDDYERRETVWLRDKQEELNSATNMTSLEVALWDYFAYEEDWGFNIENVGISHNLSALQLLNDLDGFEDDCLPKSFFTLAESLRFEHDHKYIEDDAM